MISRQGEKVRLFLDDALFGVEIRRRQCCSPRPEAFISPIDADIAAATYVATHHAQAMNEQKGTAE